MTQLISSYDAQNDCTTLHIGEHFDFPLHREFYAACLAGDHVSRSYVIDLASVRDIDSAALGMLLLLREKAGGDRADIHLVNAAPAIRNMLRIAGFEQQFSIH
ncbi:STAS domain-containing protein [Frateuria aurantia]|uniref:Anti-anti-sigma regulatory factor (Antagonist of anti-sigma factor) n=1 Tax=Frateuria aurantia (strain ATCC 33424 / DSM 6220 / KCTC 2777 / LMG 1558 / NBRC 3245 / NCIMB 13370) TaxID=767434 RepID=H8L2R6_FRAAD|nr:STAS domain-containing protein [Frateuria aurantia]AFC86425.1 anti-anti-sigma regulatory factor (antagonist of anti-sigma factor) [Frateuria aurantia DSM 6220]